MAKRWQRLRRLRQRHQGKKVPHENMHGVGPHNEGRARHVRQVHVPWHKGGGWLKEMEAGDGGG